MIIMITFGHVLLATLIFIKMFISHIQILLQYAHSILTYSTVKYLASSNHISLNSSSCPYLKNKKIYLDVQSGSS